MIRKLLDFIEASPTAFHAVATAAKRLTEAGYTELRAFEPWQLARGGRYFTTRNGSSLIAFRIPQCPVRGMMGAAAHTDSPAFRIRENPVLKGGPYTRLSVEKYGGMLCAPWLDRPLAVAGRVLVRDGDGIRPVLVDTAEPVALIPNVAIHMNRKANEGVAYDASTDMVPVYSAREPFGALIARLAGVAERDILATDLFLVDHERGTQWGDYLSSPRLDDLECAFCCLEGFLSAAPSPALTLLCLFDNEETGSSTKQGADSDFLKNTLDQILAALGESANYAAILDAGLMLSADNAHGAHPNHPELADKQHAPVLNGGVVVKFNPNYASDGVSAALLRLLAERAGAPLQLYVNRADMAGGSTLGNILNTQVSLNTVDIGLAQLAMHSVYETAGAKDAERLIAVCRACFSSAVERTEGGYRLV